MSSNRVNIHFTDEQREEAKAALAALAAGLPFLIDLTSEERSAMPRFGDKSRGFISKALDIAENNQEILPRTFSLDEFRTRAAMLVGEGVLLRRRRMVLPAARALFSRRERPTSNQGRGFPKPASVVPQRGTPLPAAARPFVVAATTIPGDLPRL